MNCTIQFQYNHNLNNFYLNILNILHFLNNNLYYIYHNTHFLYFYIAYNFYHNNNHLNGNLIFHLKYNFYIPNIYYRIYLFHIFDLNNLYYIHFLPKSNHHYISMYYLYKYLKRDFFYIFL